MSLFSKAFAVLLSIFILMFSIRVESASALQVSAESMVLINADTYEILDSKEPHKKLPMASTTKLMTALLLAETNTPEKTLVTTEEMVTVEGSSMGLLPGDTVSYYSLLVGMMLPSGNDAATTAAIALSGSLEEFAKLMNRRAGEIGMKNTNFVTPSGLDSDEHYSTAFDLALLAVEVLKNDTLSKIVSAEKLTVTYGNPPYERTLKNHNRLLSEYEYCIGLKTGYTKKSGRCLVSAAERDGCRVVAVTLDAPDDWDDHKELLEYGLNIIKLSEIPFSFSDNSIAVVGGEVQRIGINTTPLTVGSGENTLSRITTAVYLKPFIYAPVTLGQTVGRVDYIIDDRVIKSAPVYTCVALESVQNNDLSIYEKFVLGIKRICRFLK